MFVSPENQQVGLILIMLVAEAVTEAVAPDAVAEADELQVEPVVA